MAHFSGLSSGTTQKKKDAGKAGKIDTGALIAVLAALFVVPVVLGGLLFGLYFDRDIGPAAEAGEKTVSEKAHLAAICTIQSDIAAGYLSQGEEWQAYVKQENAEHLGGEKATETAASESAAQDLELVRSQASLDQLPAAKDGPEGIGGYTPSEDVLKVLNERIAKARAEGCEVGFVMLDIRTGQGIVYNTGRVFYGASSIKFHRLMAIALEDPSVVDEYPQMISDILRYSDNDAYAFLCRQYSDQALDKYAAASGASLSYTRSRRYASFDAASLARMWFYSYALIKENEACATIASYAGEPDVSLIHDVLGGKYETVSKAGWYDEWTYAATVDGGIVYDKESPYLVVVMSDYSTAFGRLKPVMETLEKAHQEIKAGP